MSSPANLRFGGIARLLSTAGYQRLERAHVAVIGLGGVGSWAAEALVRSGIGALTLVDLDEVCVSNVNRQLHALEDTVGHPKVEVLARRFQAIHPGCHIERRPEFFTRVTDARLLTPAYSFVLDAIDDLANKCLLLAQCRQRGLPVVTCGGAGGRSDPTAIRVADLAEATHDRLLAQVRKLLRHEHGFPAQGEPFGIQAVFSVERPVFPQPDGSVCVDRGASAFGAGLRLNCDAGLGTAAFVTGAYGFAAAAVVVRQIAAGA